MTAKQSSPPVRGLSPFTIPDPEQVRERRKLAGLTQTQAATLVCAKLRTWQDWEAGNSSMHAGLWELFNLKIKYALLCSFTTCQ